MSAAFVVDMSRGRLGGISPVRGVGVLTHKWAQRLVRDVTRGGQDA